LKYHFKIINNTMQAAPNNAAGCGLHMSALDKLAIFIQRCCAHHFLFSENLVFTRVQNFCCWTCERCKHLRKCKW